MLLFICFVIALEFVVHGDNVKIPQNRFNYLEAAFVHVPNNVYAMITIKCSIRIERNSVTRGRTLAMTTNYTKPNQTKPIVVNCGDIDISTGYHLLVVTRALCCAGIKINGYMSNRMDKLK